MTKVGSIIMTIALLAGLSLSVQGKWVELGGSLNVDPNKRALLSSVITHDNKLYVAWNEANTFTAWADNQGDWKNYVKCWDGKEWKQLGSNLNEGSTYNAGLPSLAMANNELYASWLTYPNQGYVNKFDGEYWLSDRFLIDISNNPVLYGLNNQLYLCVNIKSGLFVDCLGSDDWQGKGNQINKKNVLDTPSMIATTDGLLYIAWFEHADNYSLYIKTWKDNKWMYLNQDGFYTSISKPWSKPSLVVYKKQLHFAVDDGKAILVAKYDGKEWISFGKEYGVTPQLIVYNELLYVAWRSKNGIELIHLCYDGKWHTEPDVIKDGFNPRLAIINNTLYIIYQQLHNDGCIKIHLAYLKEPKSLKDHIKKDPMPEPTFIPVDPHFRTEIKQKNIQVN